MTGHAGLHPSDPADPDPAVTDDGVPSVTADGLRRLQPGRITVLGGAAVVSDSTVAQLGQFTSGQVLRIAGSDRVETAVQVSRNVTSADAVMVANAEDFINAEAAAGGAWSLGAPLLLVRPNGPVPESVLNEITRLDPDTMYIMAADDELSEDVISAVMRAAN